MLALKLADKYQQLLTLRSVVMASTSTKAASGRGKYEEGISIRAQKRKRALGHYKNRHKGEETYELDDELANETTYYLENGLRKVYPYYFNFKTFVKGRWIGRTLLDIYTQEFKQAGDDHLEAIETGSITVNGKPATPDLVLKDGMMLSHKCHRHEMPVLADPIEILLDTPEVLVINKPSSIPVHPCGRYRYNSLTFLLRHQFGYKNLRTLYRLDRLTSGVLIMPKTTSVSKKMEDQLQNRELEKQYVCRVVGRFPDGEIVCNEPLGVMSHKLSIYKVDPNGKESKTTFTRLSYNGRTSVVKCVPHTGRTHQIRLHLQFLGYPICNDPLYNSEAFGPGKGKGGVIENTVEQVEEIYMKASNVGRWKAGDNPLYQKKFGQKPVEGSNLETKDITTADCNSDSTVELCLKTEATKGEISSETDNKQSIEASHLDSNDKTEDEKGLENPAQKNGKEEELEQDSDQPLKRVKLDVENLQQCDLSAVEKNQDSDTVPESKSKCCDNAETEDSGKAKELVNVGSREEKSTQNKTVITELAKSVTDSEFVESKVTIDEYCEDCKFKFQDPDRSELILYLHAVTYRGPGWEYSTTLPYWAAEDFDERTDHSPQTL